jgi:hypothetical protein
MAAAGGSGNNPLYDDNPLVKRTPPPLPSDRSMLASPPPLGALPASRGAVLRGVRGSIGAFVATGGRTFDVEVAGANASPSEKPSNEPAAAETSDAEKAAEVLAAVRKAQAVASENPANFRTNPSAIDIVPAATACSLLKDIVMRADQAAAVYIFGGGTVKLQTSFPRPENVSRMTTDEMKLAWEKAEESISKTEKLVCHFTDLEGAGWILGTDSPGFRASKVGQGGGGVYVSSAGPHQLDWEQYHGGKFRETTGKALWGEKWEELLEDGVCANKVDMVFFIRIPEVWYTQAAPIPGRPLARVIPSSTLYEEDDDHYLQKNRIVKSYVLKRGAGTGPPHLEIQGEGAPEQQDVSMKLKFAALSGLLIFAQLMAVVAIVVATIAPGCQTNNDCDRPGTFCAPPNGWYDGGCSLYKQMDPANTLSLDQIAESCAGRGWFTPGDEGQALVSGGGRCQFCGDDSGWGLPDNSTAFCANEEIWRAEFCDLHTGWAIPAAAGLSPGDTAPQVKKCAHPACRACKDVPGFGVPAKVWMNQEDRHDGDQMWGVTDWFTTFTGTIGSMKTSDGLALAVCSMIVSFSLAVSHSTVTPARPLR